MLWAYNGLGREKNLWKNVWTAEDGGCLIMLPMLILNDTIKLDRDNNKSPGPRAGALLLRQPGGQNA